jgi:hypothetical protein
MSINKKQVIVNREMARHPYGAGGHRKNKKITKRTHFPVTRLRMVTYREFSQFWYIKLLQFLLGIPARGWDRRIVTPPMSIKVSDFVRGTCPHVPGFPAEETSAGHKTQESYAQLYGDEGSSHS